MFEHTAEHLLQGWLVLAGFALGFIVVGNLFLHLVKKDSR